MILFTHISHVHRTIHYELDVFGRVFGPFGELNYISILYEICEDCLSVGTHRWQTCAYYNLDYTIVIHVISRGRCQRFEQIMFNLIH